MYPFSVVRAHHGSSTPEANDPNPARWVVNLRPRICYPLSLLRIHSSDCKHCNARKTGGDEMQKRLEELSWRTKPRSLKNDDHGEVEEDPDSKAAEGIANPPGNTDGKSFSLLFG